MPAWRVTGGLSMTWMCLTSSMDWQLIDYTQG
jgi:hypothetical protein